MPDLVFPPFPALEREVHQDGSWTIPKESADLLAEYYVKITAVEEVYNHDKELYGGAGK